MWLLVSQKDKADSFYLLTEKEYSVGRKPDDCDIAVLNDQSVSRKHAILKVSHCEANLPHPHKPSILTIKDSSKFGTYVNDARISKDQTQILKNGDSVKFGSLQSIYQVKYQPLLMTTSCLVDSNMKRTVKRVACKLGAHVLIDWRKECNLLVMNQLSVTIKVICALISKCPVVTPEYLLKLQTAVESKTKQPETEQFLPPLAESQLDPSEVSFLPNDNRAKLFLGKKFIFLSPKQFKKLNIAIELASGVPILMEEGSDENNDSVLIQPDTCVMYTDPQDSKMVSSQNARDWVKHVLKFLAENGKRAIQDAELGYAVLYCSTETYCNPNSEPGAHINFSNTDMTSQTPALFGGLSQNTQQLSKDRTILAADTQSQLTQDSVTQSVNRSVKTPTISTVPNTASGTKLTSESFVRKPIKEEPVSQDVPVQLSSNRKRQREDGSHSEPPSKRAPSAPPSHRIKTESDKNVCTNEQLKHASGDNKVSTVVRNDTGSNNSTSSTMNKGQDVDVSKADVNISAKNRKDLKNHPELVVQKSADISNSVVDTDEQIGKQHKHGGPVEVDNDGQMEAEEAVLVTDGKREQCAPGFLNSHQKQEHEPSKSDDQEPSEIAEKLVVTEIVSLLRKTPAPKRQAIQSHQNGTSMWNGKTVKNFKKFKKVANIGSNGFPTIIGGADLVCYTSSNTTDDVDFGFTQNDATTSQSSVASRPSRDGDDLFD